MGKTKLKPQVHKIKGKSFYGLFDLYKRNLYRIPLEGDLKLLKNSLEEAGLVMKIDGVIPCKLELDINGYTSNIQIRKLQVRLNGGTENNCWQRQIVKKNDASMDDRVIEALAQNLKYIPVKEIGVEAETFDLPKITKIINTLSFDSMQLCIRNSIPEGRFQGLKALGDKKNIQITQVAPESENSISDLKVDVFHFFYSQHFNPCLGHQVAVDINGDIKPCLWSEDIVGDIFSNDLKGLIISGAFDRFWETTKDHIQVCRECEKRYNCSDCRVSAKNGQGSRPGQPVFCNYIP